MNNKKIHFTRKQLIGIVIVGVILIFLLTGIFHFLSKSGGEQALNPKSFVKSLIKDEAKAVMKEMKLVLNDIMENDLESAKKRIGSVRNTIGSARSAIETGMSMLGTDSQTKGKLVKLLDLLNAADMAMTEIALPAIDLMEEYPISKMKVGDGFNTKLIARYLDFAESAMPKFETVLKCVNAADLKDLDSDGEISGYLDLANKVMDIYHGEPEIFSMLKSMIGAEEDRLYVIAVQNPAEIRASGGFPGSVGTMRIQDGILTVGEFQSVTHMFSPTKPVSIQITNEEWELFNYLSGFHSPKDSDLCPDFERVGHIWAAAYEKMHRESVAGVFSVTPHIVQRVLDATGQEIELFDGLVMNGGNAMEVLLHDIYFKYFSVDYVAGRGKTSDKLFADAAAKTMDILTEDMSISRILDYLPILKESLEDRTLMLWMEDEKEQAFIAAKGWSGGLNGDPENPEAGVYFNCILPSKMGWYFLMDTQIGERVRNEDGSYTYPVTVTFNNNATQEEMDNATVYITGGMSGAIRGVAYFFAPAGGTVSDFAASNGQKIQLKTYRGLELGFMDAFVLKPDTPITISYQVTTAPGVETPLGISRTPTAQQ